MVVPSSQRALAGGSRAAAAGAPYLYARLNCSVPGAWAAFAVASAPNSMAGLDAVVIQPAAAPASWVQQATVGSGRSAASVTLVGATAGGTLLPTLTSLTTSAGGGWSATFARPLAAGAYAGALPVRDGNGSSTVTVAWGAQGSGTYAAGHALSSTASVTVNFAQGGVAAAPRDATAMLLIHAHGVLMFIAWGLLLPAGVFAATALQKTAPLLGSLHMRLGVAGWAVSAVAFALAVAATGLLDRPHFSARPNAHAALGLFTFLAGFLQPMLVCVAPGAHKLAGRVLVAVAAPATIFLGLAAPLAELPGGLTTAFAVLLAATLVALAWGELRARGLCVGKRGPVSAAPGLRKDGSICARVWAGENPVPKALELATREQQRQQVPANAHQV